MRQSLRVLLVVVTLCTFPFLLAQVATFPQWRIGGGASGKLVEVDSTGALLISTSGTAAAQTDPGVRTFPRVRLAGGTSGNLAEVDATGHLLVASATVGDGANVSRSTAQAITTATLTKVSFDTEDRDDHNFWEGVANPTRLTIPVTGWYIIQGEFTFASNTTGVRYVDFLWNNTTGIAGSHALPVTGASIHVLSAFGIRYFTAGDYVELRAYQTSGGNLDITLAQVAIIQWK